MPQLRSLPRDDAALQEPPSLPVFGAAAPKVAIVIVNYNCLDDVLRCLASVEQLRYPNVQVIIVDSCSPDGSGSELQRRMAGGNIRVVLSPTNEGFAASCNIGIALGRALEAELIWLLNPDTTVDPEALVWLVDEAQRYPEAAAFGSKILYGDSGGRERVIWGAGGSIDLQNRTLEMLRHGETDDGAPSPSFECDYLPGCSLLFRTALLPQAGFMPAEYFMYFEETDWCTRFRRLGYSLRCVTASVVQHHFDDTKMQSPFTIYYYNRNALLFWFRYGSTRQRLRLLAEVICRKIPGQVRALYHAPTVELEAVFRAHLMSHFHFLFGRFGRRGVV